MRKLPYILSVIPLLLFVDLAHAGDNEDVAATMDAIRAAWTAGDVDACLEHIAVEEVDVYLGNGSLLSQMDWEGARAAFAAGLKVNIQSMHTKVRVYGEAAIVTEYMIIQTTRPDGTRINETERRTVVFAKQKGQWKVVHAHGSYLTPTNPE